MQNKSKIFKKALELQTRGKFKEALKLYSKLLYEDDNNEKLLFLIGTSYYNLNSITEQLNF